MDQLLETPREGRMPCLQVPTAAASIAGVHGITAYLPSELDARSDLPLVVGDIFGAFAAAPALRHVWVQFDKCVSSTSGLGMCKSARYVWRALCHVSQWQVFLDHSRSSVCCPGETTCNKL